MVAAITRIYDEIVSKYCESKRAVDLDWWVEVFETAKEQFKEMEWKTERAEYKSRSCQRDLEKG